MKSFAMDEINHDQNGIPIGQLKRQKE